MATVLWLRQPRCAGTSTRKALEDAGLLGPDHPSGHAFHVVGGGTATIFRDRNPQLWASSTKFAVVRNPWDRVVSGWRFLHAGDGRSLRDVLYDLPGPSNFHAWHHLTRSQCDFLLDENGALMPDRLLKFERLEDEMAGLWESLGLPRLPLRRENASARRGDYRSYYDDETERLVARIFRRDIELLGYTF